MRIPREEMVKLKDIAVSNILKIDEDYTAEVCGSFRRGEF